MLRRWIRWVVLTALACPACAGAQKEVVTGATTPADGVAAVAAPPPSPAQGNSSPEPAGGGDADSKTTESSLLLAANDVGPSKTVADAPRSGNMLVYTASLGMAVYQVQTGLDAVEKVGRELGGYLSSRQDNAVTIRVPRERFNDAIARIEQLGDVTHQDIKAQDVTDEYVDLAARLKNAYAMRDRLKELLARALVKEALDIEKELGRVTEDIERMEGKLKLLAAQIAFSTISVTFSPIAVEQVHDSSLLTAFPWLQALGLQSLLNVRQ